MKTDEEKAEEAAEIRAALYRKEKRDYVRLQLDSCTYHKRFSFRPSMINCPFCRDRLKKLECKYCLARFKVVKHLTSDEMRKAAEDGYFLIESV